MNSTKSTMKSPIAEISAYLDYDFAESMLADGDVKLEDIYNTATKLQTVSEDMAGYTQNSHENEEEAPSTDPTTLRVPCLETNLPASKKTVLQK